MLSDGDGLMRVSCVYMREGRFHSSSGGGGGVMREERWSAFKGVSLVIYVWFIQYDGGQYSNSSIYRAKIQANAT